MRLIRLVLISAIVFFVILSFLFALFPSKIRISRVVEINAPAEQINRELQNLGGWSSWNLFISDTSLSGRRVSMPATGAGAFIKTDQFDMVVTAAEADSIVTRWTKPGKPPFSGTLVVVPSTAQGAFVQWYFDFQFRWYPWEKLGSLFYDKQIGPIMENSLQQLKKDLEKIH